MEVNAVQEIMRRLPERLAAPLGRCLPVCAQQLTELTLRAGRPVCLYMGAQRRFVTEQGQLSDTYAPKGLLTAGAAEIDDTVLRLCDYSVYSFQEEINGGFITIGEGVRVGLCGRAVIHDDRITNIRDIGTLSFRVAREVPGCSEALLSKILPLRGVLICGEPASGKTTLIRDMARVLSYTYRVSVLDERGELSAFSRGSSGFDLGLCDLYHGYPKGRAAVSAIRSMAPELIVCDELGDKTDTDMLRYAMRCGTAFIASVHASSMSDLRAREVTADIINTGAFRYIAFLSGRGDAGKISRIYEMCDERR